MTTAAVVVAISALAGVALVVSQLSRLRTWLDKPPPEPEPPDDSAN